MIQIKKNNYTQPTEVREEVVQAICEAFISSYVRGRKSPSVWSVYHPFRDGSREATRYVARGKEYVDGVHYTVDGMYDRFCNSLDNHDEGMTFTGAEMKRAFKELINAGYYMFRIYAYGTWMGYVCSDKPFYPYDREAEPVMAFDDRID